MCTGAYYSSFLLTSLPRIIDIDHCPHHQSFGGDREYTHFTSNPQLASRVDLMILIDPQLSISVDAQTLRLSDGSLLVLGLLGKAQKVRAAYHRAENDNPKKIFIYYYIHYYYNTDESCSNLSVRFGH
jgi:hypothetical protein